MSAISVRPLGLREELMAFELVGDALLSEPQPLDIRETFVLWNPQGRPHAAYPELIVTRPMTGREVMEWQTSAWEVHVQTTRRLFGASPVAGVPRKDRPLRGVLAFPVPFFSGTGRWTLVYRGNLRWHFSPDQLRSGTTRPMPPAQR